MALLDAFSSSSGKAAAARALKAQKKATQKAQDFLKKGQKKAVPALERAQTQAETSLNTALGQSTGALNQAQEAGQGYLTQGANAAKDYYNQGAEQALGYLGSGTDKAASQYQNALDLYTPLANAANQAFTNYGNFYGNGGQQGFDTAQAQWQASPLYKAMVGEQSLGMQALDRQAGARGNPYNGTDVLDYQTQLAGRYLPQYTSDLWRMAGLAPEIAGAQAGQYGNLANLYNNQGLAQAAIAGNLGQQQAGNANQLGQNQQQLAYNTGTQLAGQYGGTGTQLANAQLGTGGALANAYTGFGNNMANIATQQGQNVAGYNANVTAANNTANQNMWGAILGLASAGAGAAGKMYGGGVA